MTQEDTSRRHTEHVAHYRRRGEYTNQHKILEYRPPLSPQMKADAEKWGQTLVEMTGPMGSSRRKRGDAPLSDVLKGLQIIDHDGLALQVRHLIEELNEEIASAREAKWKKLEIAIHNQLIQVREWRRVQEKLHAAEQVDDWDVVEQLREKFQAILLEAARLRDVRLAIEEVGR